MVYFRFSNIAGRVTQGAPTTYMPQGVQQPSTEASAFKFDSAATRPSPVAPATGSGPSLPISDTKGTVPRHPGYQKIVSLQKAWAVQDGLMVWQKRGMRDALPLWATAAFMAVGMSIFAMNTYKMAFPPRAED